MEKSTIRRYVVGFVHGLFSRTCIFTCFAIVLSVVVFAVAYLSNIVYIIDGDNTTVTVTASRDAEEVLATENIEVTEKDAVEVTNPDGRFMEVKVVRGYPVYVTVDGATTEYNWLGGTVGQLLTMYDIEMGPHDKITHENWEEATEETEIVITRVSFNQYTETEVIPKEVVYKGTSLLTKGRSRILDAGWNGSQTHTYHEILEDGEVVETLLVDTTVTKHPKTETVLVGDGSPISRLDYSSEFPLDENGNPVNYKTVYRNQKATGYYAGPKAYGSAVYSGVKHPDLGKCVAGTVAVRSDEIPYGTRLYIKTPDGKFVYGYAIANDTGTGLVEGKIDVDLYYESYLESVLNSARFVDIYVLD